jgi:O-antigen ligase
MLYGQAPVIRVNKKFWLVMAALGSACLSIPMGLYYRSPTLTPLNGLFLVLLFLSPFLSSVVVQTYNEVRGGQFNMARLILWGFLCYFIFNMIGIGLGMRNRLHYFPGRINPPFSMGIYDAVHTFSMLSLMLLFELEGLRKNLLKWIVMVGIFLANLAVIMSINSRLSFMILFVLTILFVTRAVKAMRGLFTVSLFTMPIMMSFALLIYQILSLPFFTTILERVSKKDITTFNGRTYMWEAAWDWLLDDRRGLLLGNGYNGQYHLRLLENVARLWSEKRSYNLHLHSALLEILINQGVIGILLMYGVYWMGYRFYRNGYINQTSMAPLYAVFTYMMFAWQIDIVGFGYRSGFLLVFILMGPIVMKRNEELGAGNN